MAFSKPGDGRYSTIHEGSLGTIYEANKAITKSEFNVDCLSPFNLRPTLQIHCMHHNSMTARSQ